MPNPDSLADHLRDVLASTGDIEGVWLSVVDAADLDARLADPLAGPLAGVPFGVKDSIDVAGLPTTLSCPEYAYLPTVTAPAVARLLDAGAVLIGKTNLDQFATGLNGTRTPYPVPRSVFGGDLISGGSSSGSAVAVAAGQVPFTVATDTAGSGRVPAALNGIVGFKPSRGLISTVGLVPACRSLDCVSLMAGSVGDIAAVFDVMARPDADDAWSRPRRTAPGGFAALEADAVRIGLPEESALEFFGDEPMAAAHLLARAAVRDAFPHIAPTPLEPFLDAGALLYQGPWVAERFVEFGDFLDAHPDGVLPVVRTIIESGRGYTAADVFRAQYRLAELKALVAKVFQDVDVLVVPSIGTTFTVPEVLADPIRTNTVLGHYTHFGNLLDLCAVALPAGRTADGRPHSVTVLGPALADDTVLAVADRLLAGPFAGTGSPHLRGQSDLDRATLVPAG